MDIAFGSIELTNQVGSRVTLNVESMTDAYAKMRQFGASGWTSGEIPAGGIKLPYEMADKFDWSLIGAREWANAEGEKGVWYKGEFYKRRELEPTNKIKNKAIKYSRGANATDSDDVAEGAKDAIQYVTLAIFRGKGLVIEGLCKPQRQQERAAA